MLGLDPRAARVTWTVIAVFLFCAIIYAIRETLLIFVVALLVAYLLLPVVDFLDRRLPGKRTRAPALAIVYLTLVVLLVTVGVEVGSRAAEQAAGLASRVPELLKMPDEAPGAADSIGSKVFYEARKYIRSHTEEILKGLSQAGLRVVGAAGNLVFVVIVPILAFFFLKDGHTIQTAVLRALSVEHRQVARDIVSDLNLLLAHYMRALVVLGAVTALCYGLFFLFTGMPYGILLAAIAFPLEFIPMVGPLTSSAVIIAVAAFSGYPHILGLIVFLILFRLFQDYVLQPHLMSSGIELHPLLVIFGVFAGEQIAGIPGAFLSVPVLAALRILYRRLL